MCAAWRGLTGDAPTAHNWQEVSRGGGSHMTEDTSGAPDYYTMGFSESVVTLLRRFSAENQAKHLLPHLRPGLRLLDFGCGPGTISVGLAKAVSPGEMHGIDLEESQVANARAVAEAGGLDNAVFHVGDVTDLPFEDGFFDVAHGHAILTHVPDTEAALSEVMRVLKPGGIVSCREAVFECSFLAPGFEVTEGAWETFSQLLIADDGYPNIGKDLKQILLEAGFANPQASASFDCYSTPEDIAVLNDVLHKWFLSPDVVEAAVTYGVATQSRFDSLQRSFERWREHHGAFGAIAHGECVAYKPS